MASMPGSVQSQGFRLHLYTIPVACRSQFFNGTLVSAQRQGLARHRAAVSVKAVVAPPKKSKKELPPFEAWKTGAAVKKRTDIKTILILGPGPIIIGQASCVSRNKMSDRPLHAFHDALDLMVHTLAMPLCHVVANSAQL